MSSRVRNALIFVVAIAVSFGGGSAWQFTKASQARTARQQIQQQLDELQHQQALDRLESTLAMAALAAGLGDYERGRTLASDYFTALQAQVTAAAPADRQGLADVLARRDAIITELSRAEPSSGRDVAALLSAFQRALGKEPTVPPALMADTAGGPAM
ncbi:MAG: hypothetical protein PVH00_00480 [Gemmatimonadota bacterium]|jgi:hypothetical protein